MMDLQSKLEEMNITAQSIENEVDKIVDSFLAAVGDSPLQFPTIKRLALGHLVEIHRSICRLKEHLPHTYHTHYQLVEKKISNRINELQRALPGIPLELTP